MYDYGPLGVELKNNLKSAWWSSMVYENDNIEGLDASILSNPTVLKYSGHEDTFSDPMVDCKSCNSRFRADWQGISSADQRNRKDLSDLQTTHLQFQGMSRKA